MQSRTTLPRTDWRLTCCRLAPRSSFAELCAKFPDKTPGQIRLALHKAGVRIGMRNMIRTQTPRPIKTLAILADLREHPNANFRTVGLRHQCSAELVSQIECQSRQLGLL